MAAQYNQNQDEGPAAEVEDRPSNMSSRQKFLLELQNHSTREGLNIMDSNEAFGSNLPIEAQSMQIPRKMNNVLRIPDGQMTFEKQEEFQGLLTDVYKDPTGFLQHVQTRRAEMNFAANQSALDDHQKMSTQDFHQHKAIGKGHFSKVYYCKEIKTDTEYALKKIKIRKTDTKNVGIEESNSEGKYLKEVGLLQTLNHPFIIKCHSVFFEDAYMFIVLEWAGGGDLQMLIRAAGQRRLTFPEDLVWQYAHQVASALQYMHGQRVMHRDLKPSNILLTTRGELKVGDFGLGRYLNLQSVMAYTQVGTPLYMSPEVLRGVGHTFGSDVWSLGCVVYELAAGASPFLERNLALDKLFRKITSGQYARLPTTHYGPALRELVDAMLTVDPARRADIGAVVRAIEAVRGGAPPFAPLGGEGGGGGGGPAGSPADAAHAAQAAAAAAAQQQQQQQPGAAGGGGGGELSVVQEHGPGGGEGGGAAAAAGARGAAVALAAEEQEGVAALGMSRGVVDYAIDSDEEDEEEDEDDDLIESRILTNLRADRGGASGGEGDAARAANSGGGGGGGKGSAREQRARARAEAKGSLVNQSMPNYHAAAATQAGGGGGGGRAGALVTASLSAPEMRGALGAADMQLDDLIHRSGRLALEDPAGAGGGGGGGGSGGSPMAVEVVAKGTGRSKSKGSKYSVGTNKRTLSARDLSTSGLNLGHGGGGGGGGGGAMGTSGRLAGLGRGVTSRLAKPFKMFKRNDSKRKVAVDVGAAASDSQRSQYTTQPPQLNPASSTTAPSMGGDSLNH